MKKFCVLILSCIVCLLSAFTLTACVRENAVMDHSESYTITADVHSLYIEINAADFTIAHDDGCFVESNLKYLSVTEQDGVLRIVDTAKSHSNYVNPILALHLPNTISFDHAHIITGAGNFAADSLSASHIQLMLGAGNAEIGQLNADSSIEVKGGVGNITVLGGTLRNLDITMGVGACNMTATLLGECDWEVGVGESNLTVLGNRNSYSIEADQGIGHIMIDGQPYSASMNSERKENHLDIEGGVGAIYVYFAG